MARYFPEIVAAVAKLEAKRFALDGELIVPVKGALSFDALLQRIHPAASRIHRLAEETPAILILFDMLAGEDGRSLLRETLEKRREHLESFFGEYCRNADRLRLSPETARYSEAKRWLGGAGAALDGVIAKRRDLDYRSGARTGMKKIKNIRSVDCVVGGFRYNEGRRVVGSLLLGLYDDAGLLHNVGFTSTIKEDEKPALTEKLKPFVGPPAGIYRQCAGRAEPVVYEAVGGMGRRQTETRRRGLLRSFHRGSLSARNTPLTLAAGQGAATMYFGSAQATEAAHLGACLVVSMGNWPESDGRRSWPPSLTPVGDHLEHRHELRCFAF